MSKPLAILICAILLSLAGARAQTSDSNSRSGRGGALIFDLGGNAAEWIVSESESKIAGGSADMPADARILVRKPRPEYVGFRLIRERVL